MSSPRQLELIEDLFELEPEATYPRRAAAAIAELAGASGYRLSLATVELRHQAPELGDGLTLPLTRGDARLGTLHLFAADRTARFDDEALRLARFGARLFARGLAISARSSSSEDDGAPHERDVQALLRGTPLTPRERDVVEQLVSGASTRAIAETSGLTVSTVNTYMKRIFAKLGVHSRVELLARVTGMRGRRAGSPGHVLDGASA